MSHRVFNIEFEDGHRLFGIEEGVSGYKYRQLFASSEAAWDCRRTGDFARQEPATAKATQEAVVYDPDESWAFDTRASRVAMWLTGPIDLEECEAEQPGKFGQFGTEAPKEVAQPIPLRAGGVEVECPYCGAVAVQAHKAESAPADKGAPIESPVVAHTVACHACRRDFIYKTITV